MIWLMLLMAEAPQSTAPVYLTCELTQETGKLAVAVALDEANQKATVSLPSTGYTTTRNAVFSPDRVVIVDGEQTFSVSRIDLSFHRSFAFMPASDTGESGVCAKKPVPARRAF